MISPVDTEIREIEIFDSIDHTCTITWFRLGTFHGDPAERFGVKTVRAVGNHTGSQLTLNHALIWIKEYLSSQDQATDCFHIKNEDHHKALANFRYSQDSSGRADLEMSQQEQRQHDGNEPTSEHQLKSEIDFLYRTQHLSKLQPQDMQTQRPSRLIHITTSPEDIERKTDRLDLRLVETPSTDVAYVALTYTWGTAVATWKTTMGNIVARKEQLPFGDLPLTIQQAVTIAARLGLRYIWIDSICVVQDDMNEWQRESLLMANVYQNALVTLAADDSRDSHSGLYNTVSTSLFKPRRAFRSILFAGQGN